MSHYCEIGRDIWGQRIFFRCDWSHWRWEIWREWPEDGTCRLAAWLNMDSGWSALESWLQLCGVHVGADDVLEKIRRNCNGREGQQAEELLHERVQG